MDTESGYEEFLLLVRRKHVVLILRDDGQTSHHYWHEGEKYLIEDGYKVVKAYAMYDGGLWNYSAVDSEIGYHEQRLTPLERLAVRCYVGNYWDIPF